jgi:hypothetical protein
LAALSASLAAAIQVQRDTPIHPQLNEANGRESPQDRISRKSPKKLSIEQGFPQARHSSYG